MYKLYLSNQVLYEDIKLADTFMKRLRGFMFYKKAPVTALVIKPCNSIHTFFMRFDLDVLFLDQDMLVLKKIEGLKKNKMIAPVKQARYVIETTSGGFNSVSVGDIMHIC